MEGVSLYFEPRYSPIWRLSKNCSCRKAATASGELSSNPRSTKNAIPWTDRVSVDASNMSKKSNLGRLLVKDLFALCLVVHFDRPISTAFEQQRTLSQQRASRHTEIDIPVLHSGRPMRPSNRAHPSAGRPLARSPSSRATERNRRQTEGAHVRPRAVTRQSTRRASGAWPAEDKYRQKVDEEIEEKEQSKHTPRTPFFHKDDNDNRSFSIDHKDGASK